jgi:DNA-binding PadR family transcriptional regulator
MLRFVLLALLARSRQHGYELKSTFERLLGGIWPLNIGQVYTALGRLEDDGLVACEVVPQDNVPDRKVYRLTELGEKELARWLQAPVPAPIRLRDEGFLKVILHETAGGDPSPVIAQQRADHLDAVAAFSRLRTEPDLDEATALLVDAFLLRLDADLKWLELVEDRRATRQRRG